MKRFILIGLICMGSVAQASSATNENEEKTKLEKLAWDMAMRTLPDGRMYKRFCNGVDLQNEANKAKSDEILAGWNQQRGAMQEEDRSALDRLIAKYREKERAAARKLVKPGKASCPIINSWNAKDQNNS